MTVINAIRKSMIQILVGCAIAAVGTYLYTHDSMIWGILVLVLAVGVVWGSSVGAWFYIPLRGWFRNERSGANTGTDGCEGGGGDGGGGD